jgi:hypothetical protein
MTPPGTGSYPKQVGPARKGFDLSRCGIFGEIAQSMANSLPDGRVKCLVLLAGTRGQLNLVGGHRRLALGKLNVNVGEPVGTPVIGFPLGECFFCDREVSGVFERQARQLRRCQPSARMTLTGQDTPVP